MYNFSHKNSPFDLVFNLTLFKQHLCVNARTTTTWCYQMIFQIVKIGGLSIIFDQTVKHDGPQHTRILNLEDTFVDFHKTLYEPGFVVSVTRLHLSCVRLFRNLWTAKYLLHEEIKSMVPLYMFSKKKLRWIFWILNRGKSSVSVESIGL